MGLGAECVWAVGLYVWRLGAPVDLWLCAVCRAALSISGHRRAPALGWGWTQQRAQRLAAPLGPQCGSV